MSFIQANLHQDVTYWGPGEQNRYGSVDYVAPIKLKGRWEAKTEQIRKPNGDLVTSTSQVYLSAPVAEGGYLILGDHTASPTPTGGAQEVQGYQETPDLRNLDSERKAYL